ncbi:MAG: radical SAM family heme chaperone HemW [Ignavibacteria bacterium]|nr:radical SAM family heme chaperone HemW [Ignavibacteria bacterium]MBI3765103.1 radical SAM family heme chaperone HemW [Ignavibacteriales bacterium]
MASIYLHIPFCEHKCIYCDFYSIESLDPMNAFLESLHNEIEMYASYGAEEQFETIFFGGGTPSLLEPATLEEILVHLRETFSIEPDAEITVETNPGTVDYKKLAGYRRAGVNRLSFGVQSFYDDDLKFLTRIHSANEARQAIHTAKDVGFTNINLDLISALPNQTVERWRRNLDEAIVLEPQHISAYNLIVEKGTPLARMVSARQVSPLPVETEAEMYEWTMQYLHDEGYEHYEVSNYAKPGFRSRHNSNYWNHSNYLGFGPSAHSFWLNRRWWNTRSVESYCHKIAAGQLPLAGEERLTGDQLVDEAVMLGLRSNGVDLALLKSKHQIDLLSSVRPTIENLLHENLVVLDKQVLRLTSKGFLLCDAISESLLSRVAGA